MKDSERNGEPACRAPRDYNGPDNLQSAPLILPFVKMPNSLPTPQNSRFFRVFDSLMKRRHIWQSMEPNFIAQKPPWNPSLSGSWTSQKSIQLSLSESMDCPCQVINFLRIKFWKILRKIIRAFDFPSGPLEAKSFEQTYLCHAFVIFKAIHHLSFSFFECFVVPDKPGFSMFVVNRIIPANLGISSVLCWPKGTSIRQFRQSKFQKIPLNIFRVMLDFSYLEYWKRKIFHWNSFDVRIFSNSILISFSNLAISYKFSH